MQIGYFLKNPLEPRPFEELLISSKGQAAGAMWFYFFPSIVATNDVPTMRYHIFWAQDLKSCDRAAKTKSPPAF